MNGFALGEAIKSALLEKGIKPYSLEDQEAVGAFIYAGNYHGNWPLKTDIGDVTIVEDHVGIEGGGENAYYVVNVFDRSTLEESFWRINGYYSSWDGVDWTLYGDSIEQVYPKTVVRYFTSGETPA